MAWDSGLYKGMDIRQINRRLAGSVARLGRTMPANLILPAGGRGIPRLCSERAEPLVFLPPIALPAGIAVYWRSG